jgi:hypothetical protein
VVKTIKQPQRFADGEQDDLMLDDREEILEKLADLGFSREVAEACEDQVLAEILRVLDTRETEVDDDDDELPEPRDEEERQAFLEEVQKFAERSRRAVKKYSYSGGTDASGDIEAGGFLGTGTSKERSKLALAECRRKFAENERGLRAMGINSPEELRQRLAGKIKDPPAGGAGGLTRAAAENKSLIRLAEKFCEQPDRKRAMELMGVSKHDFVQSYLNASPSQRAWLIPAGR